MIGSRAGRRLVLNEFAIAVTIEVTVSTFADAACGWTYTGWMASLSTENWCASRGFWAGCAVEFRVFLSDGECLSSWRRSEEAASLSRSIWIEEVSSRSSSTESISSSSIFCRISCLGAWSFRILSYNSSVFAEIFQAENCSFLFSFFYLWRWQLFGDERLDICCLHFPRVVRFVKFLNKPIFILLMLFLALLLIGLALFCECSNSSNPRFRLRLLLVYV